MTTQSTTKGTHPPAHTSTALDKLDRILAENDRILYRTLIQLLTKKENTNHG